MRPVLIFDGDCAFCSSSIRWAQRRVRHLPRAVPHQTFDDEALDELHLDRAACNAAVQFVDADGTVSSGERAVAAVLRRAGGVWKLLGVLLGLPVVRSIAGLVYRWVARNRHRLPGGTPACGINDRS